MRGRNSRCDVCGGKTGEGKPFCKNHLDESPHIRWLNSILERIDADALLLKKKGKVPLDSPLFWDVEGSIKVFGELTIPRLARITNLDPEDVDILVRFSPILIISGTTGRGAYKVSLTDEAKAEPKAKREDAGG